MPKLFDPAISKATKRLQPRVQGYFTTPEAAEKLGVDPSTLRYRRDTATAKSFWDALGIAETDETYRLLFDSHNIINGKHYYEVKAFTKFAKKYLARPEVIRARKAKVTWVQSQKITPLLSVEVASAKQVDELAKVLMLLLAQGTSLTVSVIEK